VDEGDRRRRSDVAELRLRLYRRDPPVGAVEAYLAALALVPAAPLRLPAVPRARVRRRPPSVRTLLTTVSVVAGSLLVAALIPVGMRQLGTVSAIAGPQPAPTEAMPLPPTTGTALGTMAGGPASTARFAASGHQVVVSVLCSGSGTMRLRIGDEPPTVLTCDSDLPALALMQSLRPLDRFALEVVPDRAVHWSVAVGALPAPTSGPSVATR
jgi:hypothetical protein